MAAHADRPKMAPAGDDLTAQVKAALSGPVEALYPELRDTRTPLAAVEE